RTEQPSLRADADDRRRLEGLDRRDNFGVFSRQIARIERLAGRQFLYPRLLVRSETGTTFDNESLRIKQRNLAAGLGLRLTLHLHRFDDQLRDAGASRSGAEEQNALAGDQRSGNLQRRHQARQCNGSCALNVVVVAEDLISIAIEIPDRVRSLPVFEVDAALRENLLHSLDKLLDQFIEFFLRRWHLANTEIKRIGTQHGI